jgi:hypothetical protein
MQTDDHEYAKIAPGMKFAGKILGVLVTEQLLAELDPFLANIRGEERFKKLMERVKYEWEHFMV